MEVRTPGPGDIGVLRAAVGALDVGDATILQFGDPSTFAVRLPAQGDEGGSQRAVAAARGALEQAVPGTRILRVEAVGNRVSDELFLGGMIALGLSFAAMLVYIWVRFEWQFAIAGVTTLLLDTTKVVGVMVATGIEFNLTTVAAILTIIGFNANDKVVVFDRMRENLRKYKTMPLDQLVDLSINETLNRTLGTSMTLLLSALPLALFGGDALAGFAWLMIARHRDRHLLLHLHRRAHRALHGADAAAAQRAGRRRGASQAGCTGAALTMRLRRRALLGAAAAMLVAPATASPPAAMLTLVVGARRGAPSDHWARGFVPFIERHWPRIRVTIENVRGDGGLRAAQDAAAAPAGACRVVLAATPNLLARAVERNRPEVPANLTWLAAVAQEPVVLVALPGTEIEHAAAPGPSRPARHLVAWRSGLPRRRDAGRTDAADTARLSERAGGAPGRAGRHAAAASCPCPMPWARCARVRLAGAGDRPWRSLIPVAGNADLR